MILGKRILLICALLISLGLQVNSAEIEVNAKWQPFSVKDYGAKGDGKTDDTTAIQRCITTVEKLQAKYNKAETAYPEIIFPPGEYLISRPIAIATMHDKMNLSIKGLGEVAIVQKNPDMDIFYMHSGYRQSIENITFIGGKIQIKFFSKNLNRAQLLVRNCRFINSSSYAIDDALKGVYHTKLVAPYKVSWQDGLPSLTAVEVDSLPDVYFTSTVMHIDKSEFINCMNVARVFADWATISNCKIVTNPGMKGAAIYARGVVKIKDTTCFVKTNKSNNQRFVDNINAGTILQNVNIDTDGAGICPIYNRRIYENGSRYNSYNIIENCNIKAAGSAENCFIYCEEMPNLISITNSTETSGKTIPAVGFRIPITEEYLRYVSFPKLVKRLPELSQIYGLQIQPKTTRSYKIRPNRFPHNMAISLYDNKNLSYKLPEPLKQFIEKPLPKNIQSRFATTKKAVSVHKLKKTTSVNIYKFGAKGDGKHDDTAAIQKAIDFIGAETDSELVFPHGIYKVSKSLILPPNIYLRGLGLACFSGTPDVDTLFIGKNSQQVSFVNIGFYNVKNAVEISTSTDEHAKILFDHCSFSHISNIATSCLSGTGGVNEANHTELRISDCMYQINGQALVSNVSNAIFEYNWVSLHNKAVKPGTLVNKGLLQIIDCIGIPSVLSTTTWIQNYGTLLLDNMRFGGEGNLPKILIENNSTMGEIFMKRSWLYCDNGSIINCNQLPSVVALKNNVGSPGNRQTMIVVNKTAKGKIADCFFESGNISPSSIKDHRKNEPLFTSETSSTNKKEIKGIEIWDGVVKMADAEKHKTGFVVEGAKLIKSTQLIEIDPTATYKLSGSFKSGNAKPNQIYFGLTLHDKNKSGINSTSVTPLADSETILVAPANNGDQTISFKSIKNWQSALEDNRLLIAFDIDDSGAYSDLPNYKTSSLVTKLTAKNGHWEATLKKPLTFSYPTNTKIRAQLACGHLMYALILRKQLPKWTSFSNIIAPAQKSGSQAATMWHGTKFVKILLLANWGQKNGEVLLFKNIKLEKIK